jgi:biotin carboxyl carrier protein
LQTKQSGLSLLLPDCSFRSQRRSEISTTRNKIPLAEQATSGNLPRQQKAVREDTSRRRSPENGMPEIKVVTEVAGRVCALPVAAGASVSDGDDIALVEAMKMEIPVASPAAGKLKSLLVKIDEVVAEGQAIAIVET